jgi:phosphoribosylformylglycinamidine synthase
MMIGKTSSTSSIPPNTFSGAGSILLVGDIEDSLGGSVYLHEHGGNDNFHSIILDPLTRLKKIAELTQMDSTLSIHDVGDGGIATTLSEMVSKSTGASINLQSYDTIRALFNESPGRVIVESTDPKAVESLFNSIAPVYNIGNATNKNRLDISTSSTNLSYSTKEITILQDIIAQTMDS